jgi:signal transduction histidine kinase
MQLSFEEKIADAIWVRADPALLRTAVLNLFVNAVKYNEPGGRIEATLSAKDGNAVLVLCNTGPGIPAEDQDRVFTRFHRADTARNRRVDGVGLGLNLSREILRAHGGELELQGCRPGWTCFELRMSLAGDRVNTDQRPPR